MLVEGSLLRLWHLVSLTSGPGAAARVRGAEDRNQERRGSPAAVCLGAHSATPTLHTFLKLSRGKSPLFCFSREGPTHGQDPKP